MVCVFHVRSMTVFGSVQLFRSHSQRGIAPNVLWGLEDFSNRLLIRAVFRAAFSSRNANDSLFIRSRASRLLKSSSEDLSFLVSNSSRNSEYLISPTGAECLDDEALRGAISPGP